MNKSITLRDRVGMALDILSNRAFRAESLDAKKFKFAWPAWREGKPEWHIVDIMSYINEGFNLNSIIYSSIMYKARAVTQAPLRAYTGDLENPKYADMTHPLSKLAMRPNPFMARMPFQQLGQVYLNIAGECFILLDRPRPSALPEAMYLLRPDRVRIVPGGDGLLGYVYVPEGHTDRDGIPILPADMLHVKLPNPGDPLEGLGHGLSPISPLAHSADVDNMVTDFLKLFFERGAMVQGVLKFNTLIDEDTLERVKARFMEMYGSYKNWTEVGVLDEGAEYQRISLTFEEMGFEALDDRNESRMTGPFGVPPILIGSRFGLKHGTYENYKEARRSCWEDTLIPELLLFEEQETYQIRDESSGVFLMYDFSGVPALQRNIIEQIDAATKLWTMGYSADVATAAVGLEIEKGDFTDVEFLPSSVVTADSVANPPEPPPKIQVLPPGAGLNGNNPPPALPAGEQQESEAEQNPPTKEGRIVVMPPFYAPGFPRKTRFSLEEKTALWWKVNAIAESWEDSYADRAEQQFEDDLRALLAILQDYKTRVKATKASVSWESVEQDWTAYLTFAGEQAWRDAFQPLIEGTMLEQGQEWASTLGMQFDVRNLDGEVWFSDYMLQFAQPIMQTTLDTLHDVISQSLKEAWSIPTMQSHLKDVFQQWMTGDLTKEDFDWFNSRMPPHRRELIARTESMRASNAGSHNLFGQWGVGLKEWLATQDGRVRPTHAEAGRKYSEGGEPGPIPMNQQFHVGSTYLMFPGDPGGDIGETANCRCAELPFLGEGVQLSEIPAAPTTSPIVNRGDLPTQDDIDNGTYTPLDPSKAGINTSYILENNGKKFFVKEGMDESNAINEASAPGLAKILGIDHLFPNSKRLNDYDVAMEYLPDFKSLFEMDDKERQEFGDRMGKDGISNTLLWDYLFGNRDRHSGNIGSSNDRSLLIDNESMFGIGPGGADDTGWYQRTDIESPHWAGLLFQDKYDAPIDIDVAKDWLSHADDLAGAVQEIGDAMNEYPMKGFLKRISVIEEYARLVDEDDEDATLGTLYRAAGNVARRKK